MLKEISVPTQTQVQLKNMTREVQELVSNAGFKDGIVVLFVPHTTAAITINENADPDVVTDMVNGINQLIPMRNQYLHLEGNSAAHIKCSLIGASEQIIVRNGKLLLGPWQGIFFCEFDGPRTRKLQIKMIAG